MKKNSARTQITLNKETLMHPSQSTPQSREPTGSWLKGLAFASAILLGFQATLHAQDSDRVQPTWWFGGAAAANLNFYGGTTQALNPALTTPAPFHKGFGTGLYLAPL